MRNTRVGPRRQSPEDVGKPEDFAASPVVGYRQGDFVYYTGSESTLKISGQTSLILSAALVEEVIQAVAKVPEFWLVGVDQGRGLIELRPAEDPKQIGALKTSDAGRIRSKGICSKTLIRWLREAGVPDTQFPAHWQPPTVAIVGNFTPRAPS